MSARLKKKRNWVTAMKQRVFSDASTSAGQCLCGTVRFEIDFPARWAWHDHSRASRLAHGGVVYATYVGSWRKRFRITAGEREITRYEDKAAGAARSFCRHCGTPVFYERCAFAAHGQHPARAVREPHRAAAAVSRRASTSCRTGPMRASRWFRSRVSRASSGSAPEAGSEPAAPLRSDADLILSSAALRA